MAGPQINDARLSLEIRTKSVEQTLIPLVTQVGPFVGFILAFSKQTMVFFIVYHFFQSDFGLMHLLQYRPRMPRLEFFCLSRVFFFIVIASMHVHGTYLHKTFKKIVSQSALLSNTW